MRQTVRLYRLGLAAYDDAWRWQQETAGDVTAVDAADAAPTASRLPVFESRANA